MPVHTGKGSRSYGTILIDRGNPVARGSSKPVTRKFDVSHYELTGEIRYLDEVEGNRVKNINRADRMRIEVDSVEQIKRLGGIGGVASYYKVSYSTAQKHCQAIENREKSQEIPAPVESDLAPSEPVGAPEDNPISEVESEPRRTTEAIALELIAKVREQEVSVIFAKIGAYFGQANQAMDDLLKTESKIDRLMYEIQADLLKVVERELGVALEVGK